MFDLSLVPNLGENRPDLFVLQWEAIFEALAAIVLLSLIVERFLSPFFESNAYIKKQRQWDLEGEGNYKTPIAFVVSFIACTATGVDILAVMSQSPSVSLMGLVFSAGVVAGGSKGSIKLFRDFLDFKSTAYRDYKNEAKPTDPNAPAAHVVVTTTPATGIPPVSATVTVSGAAVQATPAISTTSVAPVVLVVSPPKV